MTKQEAEGGKAADSASPGLDMAKRWSKPLRVHLSFTIVALLVCISVPLMWLTYLQGHAAGIAAGEAQMRQFGLRVLDSYQKVYNEGYSAVSTASVLTPLLSPPPMEMTAKTDYLLKVLQSSSYVDGIYVGYPGGSFVHAVSVARNPRWVGALQAPPGTAYALRTIEKSATGTVSKWRFLDADNMPVGERTGENVAYDPQRRPWYRAAVRAGGQVSVGPYVSATTRSLSLTLAMPMAKNKDIVVGADVLLETLSQLLNQDAVSKRARGYVFDSQDRLFVHSDPGIMARIIDRLSSTPVADDPSIFESDPVLLPVSAALREKGGNGGPIRFMVGNEPYIAQISPVAFSGVLRGNTVVLAAPLDDFVGESNRLLAKNLLIAGGLVLAGIVAAILLSRLVSKALYALAGEAKQIGNLEFEGQADTYSRISEINVLSNALAAARDAIHTFSLYVPRELVRKIVGSGQATAGMALRQDVTIVFTDIQDFTTISEQHSPEGVVALLSTYFELMNEVVERHDGTIVQYIGDSIFAMWNAPVADPQHVEKGCACALALKVAIDELNSANRTAGRPEFITRYGLHTGPAVVGSVGAHSRRQYTAMGDTVNVASRLEGMNKQFGTTILASGAVRELAGEAFLFRDLGLAQAKGRQEQIEVFELLAENAQVGTGPASAAAPTKQLNRLGS
ncbi:adenylate/guanylate cyclase domain-containing protein [Ferirhizobium litorale]|uniref:Adenylate/guanylate cyclase domain-containing protein n=1 Tax=Ferirhizobium litorale TaxID=2927786 RepID=A0AAE3Q969_9HYPH|nr:adenylate/guanylate cyclase domain-containing protein [Fererhizobium litorale]MDI7921527.1 adenylate/guanylate cyclase domain-containing protein [Fererhizobium litorale]